MELEKTIELMTSEDYKDRFKAEVYQLRTRIEKLEAMIEKWDDGRLNFTPSCPRSIYDLQLRAMKDYYTILEARAAIEHVEI